jgi:hypothetical protein
MADIYTGVSIFGLGDIAGNTVTGTPATATQPPAALQVGGWDGTNFRVLQTSAAGALVVSGTLTTVTTVTTITNAVTVVGAAASGASKSGNPVQTGGVFNTTQPTVTTGQAVESQYTARGAQIVATGVEAFAVTLTSTTITGTVAATQSGNWTTRIVGNTGTVLDAAATQNVAAPAGMILTGAEFNTTPTTITNGNVSPLQLDSAGNLLVNVKTGGTSGTVAQSSTTSGQTGMLVQGAVSTAAPAYTTAQTNPLSLNLAGGLRVDGSGVTQPISIAAAQTLATLTTITNAVKVVGNAGGLFDAVAAAAVPANVLQVGGSDGTNLQSLRLSTNRSVVMVPADEALASLISNFSWDTGLTLASLTATESPIFSLKTNSATKVFTIRGIELSGNGTLYRWRLIRNPGTLTTSSFAATPPTGSSVLIDIAATVVTSGTGTVVDSGYVSAGQIFKPLTTYMAPGAPGDVYTLAATAAGGTTAKCLMSIQWTESAAAL